ncbi:hypothetical protein [Nocardia sp. NPDC005998]|uniref:hypothetical protein n=1 Tax=Nocardia sp. NPDC005998 TaxID=3156894 RepID=UPI0033B1694A
MATEGFGRLQRIVPPRPPGGEVVLNPPPEPTRSLPGGLLGKLMPVVMVVAMVGMVAMMITAGGRSVLSNPLSLTFPMMLMSMSVCS